MQAAQTRDERRANATCAEDANTVEDRHSARVNSSCGDRGMQGAEGTPRKVALQGPRIAKGSCNSDMISSVHQLCGPAASYRSKPYFHGNPCLSLMYIVYPGRDFYGHFVVK